MAPGGGGGGGGGSSGVLELIMFLDVCRLYLETRRRPRGPCTLWAIVTFLRTEAEAADFLRWCQAYRTPALRQRRDQPPAHLGQDGAGSPRFGRRLHGLERKITRVLQELFYCGSCLPPGDLAL